MAEPERGGAEVCGGVWLSILFMKSPVAVQLLCSCAQVPLCRGEHFAQRTPSRHLRATEVYFRPITVHTNTRLRPTARGRHAQRSLCRSKVNQSVAQIHSANPL
eukprot:1401578-Prymnesium_polylepis.1